MSKDEAILCYRASLAIFKSWLSEGIITKADLRAIDTKLAEKYGLSSCSIFLENDLLCREKRVIDSKEEGFQWEEK